MEYLNNPAVQDLGGLGVILVIFGLVVRGGVDMIVYLAKMRINGGAEKSLALEVALLRQSMTTLVDTVEDVKAELKGPHGVVSVANRNASEIQHINRRLTMLEKE